MDIGNRGRPDIPVDRKSAAARALCLGWACLASAGWGQGGWQDLARPWSATLTAFAACPSSESAVLLAGSRSGRVFRSVDEGKSWAQTPVRMGTDAKGFLDLGGGVILAWAGWTVSPLWDCWSMDCGDPTRPGGLFRSTDGGLAWTRVGPEHGVTAVAAVGSAVYAMGRADLYRSADRGATWRKLARSGTAVIGMDRMDGAGNILVGSAWNRFDRIVLSGDTARWDPVSGSDGSGDFLGKHLGFLYAYRAAPGSQARLMRSRDGTTWQAVSDRRLQHMAATGNRLLGRYLDTLYESADLGFTWKVSETALEGKEHAFLEEGRGRVYLGGSTAKGLLRLDGGRWEWISAGMHDLPPGPMLSTESEILHADPNLGLATRFYSHLEWATPRIDDRPLAGVLAFGALGKTALAAVSPSLAYRTDSLGFRRPLGPEAWRPDSGLGFRAAATGRGWMALFQDGKRILLCEGGGAVACRDGAIQDLPVESATAPIGAILYHNRFRAMAASGDSLAVALDSLYLSADRGATFRNLGALERPPAWLAFHDGGLYAGTLVPMDTAGSNLLRLDPADGKLVPHAFPGTGAAKAIRGMATSARGDAFLATPDGVYRWNTTQRIWQDIGQGLPSRNVLGITLHDQVCVAALESGQLMATNAYVVGTRPARPRAVRAQARRPGLQPLFADPAGLWRRVDGRTPPWKGSP